MVAVVDRENPVEWWRELGEQLRELDPPFFAEVSARVEIAVEARRALAEQLIVLRNKRRL